MGRSKPPCSKKQRGVDFNKIKRKIGRKLPPPKNATSTEIKSKAIILPEQSVASNKAGLAVSKKGLTLKELLQQTSHHNAKVRKDALMGIRQLVHRFPAELKLHKLAILENLRVRISDKDKVVREMLYQLLKEVIFPGSKEDIPGPFISSIMYSIFNAMTDLAIDIRLMAFKFFDLVVQHNPSSFLPYADKVLQNYEDMLRKNQVYLHDKGKVKSALDGLVRGLSLLPCKERKTDPSDEKVLETQRTLHAFELEEPMVHTGISSIIKKLKDLMPVLVNCFLEFTSAVRQMPVLETQSFDCMQCALQSIDLAGKFLFYGINKHQTAYDGPDVMAWGENAMPVFLRKLFEVFPLKSTQPLSEKDLDRYFVLNAGITEIFLHFSEWTCTNIILVEKFLEFMETSMFGQNCGNIRSSKALREKHLVSLLQFIPKLVSQIAGDWKSRLLQAFTIAFKNCKTESSLKLVCLSAIKEMLLPVSRKQGTLLLDATDSEILDHQITWLRELPLLLLQFGDKHLSSLKVVLNLLLCLVQYSPVNSSLAWEYENMQYSLRDFYCTCLDNGSICYGPFIKLPRDCQELSICCLYYFSSLDSLLLRALSCCCLSNNLEPFVLFKIIEVLHAAYKAGHVQIADHISFFVTLLARFRVYPENFYPSSESDEKISNHGTFKAITSAVCSCLSQMGDDNLVLQTLEKIIVDEINLNLPLYNKCALLRILVILDSRPTRLSEQSIIKLSKSLLEYLIDAASSIPENADGSSDSVRLRICRYLLIPCFFMFDRSDKLLNLVLDLMGSSIGESNTSDEFAFDQSRQICAIASILLFMYKDVKIQRRLLLCRVEVHQILQNILLQSSTETNMSLGQRHRVQSAFDQLQSGTTRLYCWNNDAPKKNS
ncbi:hypothetical protein NE237_021195 [Protea cynaroides]|uniref:Pre-rRNA-processing protein Ipi1 N-terminal domain-containing protein n=1 Tax=Protea cynaroides TaxID=273540 RepID=A0A9Q0HAV2_9MAGN|nr:hypothetical protein NE237_021195 [Protea cynaroides]